MRDKPAIPYITKDFFGTVILKDWILTMDNRQVRALTGRLTLVKDEEIAGFKVHGTESNWGMRIVGHREQWTVLGCQIRAVVAHAENAPIHHDVSAVVP